MATLAAESAPILDAPLSVNQMRWSGPVTNPNGKPPAVGVGNPVRSPDVSIRSIALIWNGTPHPAQTLAVNHSAPSGPTVINPGLGGTSYSVTVPPVVILPTTGPPGPPTP